MNLKQEIIKELDRFENPDVLAEILDWIREYDSVDEMAPMSEALKKRIAHSEEQIKNGEVVSNDEVFAKFDQWLDSK